MDYHREKTEFQNKQEEIITDSDEGDLRLSALEESETDPKEEPVEWDGSETELVADDDASDYEEQSTGIGMGYILHEQEIFEAIKKSGFSKTTGKRAIIETVILSLLVLIFAGSSILQENLDSLIFAVISFLLIGVIWVIPYMGMKNRAKQLANGKEIHLEIYPDEIQVGEGLGEWKILLDGNCECEVIKNLFVLFPSKSHLLILPMRCIEPAVLPEVQAMLLAGTQSRDK